LNQSISKITKDDDAVQRFNEDHIETASEVKKKLFNISNSGRSINSRVMLQVKLQANQGMNDTLSRFSHASRPQSSHSRISGASRAFVRE